MMKPLSGTKIAVLVANGFEEKSFLEAQKMIIEMGATMRIISTNQGLVNGWEGESWGHNYAVDAPLNTALGVDYNALVIPGGMRSIDKLKMTAHTRRFIGSFMASQKPVMVMGDAVMLMAHAEQLDGKVVAGPTEARALSTQQGAEWSEEPMIMDGSMLTGIVNENHKEAYFGMMREMLCPTDIDQAA